MTNASPPLDALIMGRELIRSGRARAIRQRVGLKMSDIAREVGRDESTVSLWERQIHTPRGEAGDAYALLLYHLAYRVAPILGRAGSES